jgi:hypothetical protein
MMSSQDEALTAWTRQLERSGLTEDEIAAKVAVLEKFCAFAEASPKELVERCLSNGSVVIKERKRIEKLIDEFAGDSVSDANVIRSFMIHNGVRMIAPKPPWL